MIVLYTREWWRFGWVMPGTLARLRDALEGLDEISNGPAPRPPTEALASVEQARARLRLDADFPEADIELALAGASEAVMSYLKYPANYETNTAPPNVVNAVLLLAGIFLRDPDGVEAASNWEQGYLPHAITALLYPLRDPACE
jgi:hypothetical protein